MASKNKDGKTMIQWYNDKRENWKAPESRNDRTRLKDWKQRKDVSSSFLHFINQTLPGQTLSFIGKKLTDHYCESVLE